MRTPPPNYDNETAKLKRAELIGGLFAQARKRSQLSTREITEATGLARSALFHIEKGSRKNGDDEVRPVTSGTGTLAKLANILKLTPIEFQCLANWGRSDIERGVLAIRLGLDPDNPSTYVLLDGLTAVRARFSSPGAFLDWVMLATGGYHSGP